MPYVHGNVLCEGHMLMIGFVMIAYINNDIYEINIPVEYIMWLLLVWFIVFIIKDCEQHLL